MAIEGRKQEIMVLFRTAMEFTERGHHFEVNRVRGLKIEDVNEWEFLYEYVYVVLNSGMKNQVAEKIFDRWHNSYRDPQVIGHPGKRKAVREALDKKWEWLHHIKDELNNDSDRLEYIGTLPFMGPITKYHLARNIGLDVAKPDRHLTRLAGKYGFPGVQEMCRYISERTSERIGAVDVILWRYCNMHPKLFSGTGEYPEAVI